MSNYKLVGDELHDSSGRKIGRNYNDEIQDASGRKVLRIYNDEFQDASGRKIASLHGEEIQDASGRKIATVSDIRRQIDGAMGGKTIVAFWLAFIK